MAWFRRAAARTAVATAIGAGTAALVLSGCTADPRPISGQAPAREVATQSGPDVGSRGLGDPYFPLYGNGGYDVGHYTVKVRYEPARDELTGTATIEATATANLARFNLDFAAGGLVISRLEVDGAKAKYARDGDELMVRPRRTIAKGVRFTAEVAYAGRPGPLDSTVAGLTGGFTHTDDGAIAIGEPVSATTWFPVNDHPLDKATYTIELTVPDGLAALSNGVLAGTTRTDGWTTTTWRVTAPMASYLTALAIGEYRVTTRTHKGKPVITAVSRSVPVGAADAAMARTAEIADFLETVFGPYPFDAYGGIVFDESRIGFALETQTRPMYSAHFFDRGEERATAVVAHELAHQWFGDSVSVHHWQDIWLNEGFASYAEWLWSEHAGGESAEARFARTYAESANKSWDIPPGDPDRAGLFDSFGVYGRGAMALHVLRRQVRDGTFVKLLKTWAAEKRNGNATVLEFITVAERVSGKPLRPLFDAWLYGRSRPPG